MRLEKKITLLILALILSLEGPLCGQNNESQEDQPTLFYAESQTYDRELGILILKGNVEFEHQGNVLEADYVTYNEKTDIVTASGNVRLREDKGDISFAEYVELTGDLKDGIVLQLRTLLKDDSKVAALEGRKYEDREELDQVVYTPCKLCGNRPPTWQLNARSAVKDNVGNDIHFTDAEFRVLDIPLFYLPYSTQPLERRSGFQIPRPGYSTDFGATLAVPYYIVLSQSDDMTLTPVFFEKQAPMLYTEYRKAFGSGIFNVEGSITKYRKNKKEKEEEKKGNYDIPDIRGHIYGETKFNINDIWRSEISGGYVSDKTYFRKYKYTGWQSTPVLESKAILEGLLNQRDYAAAKVYHFQGLRDSDVQSRIAAPIPMLEYSAYSGVDPWGGRFAFEGNLLNLYREKDGKMQRGIGEVSWQRPWMLNGQVITAFASTRGDLYKIEHYTDHKRGGVRFFPQAGLDWRFPFINSACNKQRVIFQPMGQLIAAPDKAFGLKAREVPDEDSTDFEFNDANLFSRNRFPGYDVIDTGSRAVYGGQILTTGALFGDMEFFLGQNYFFSKPNREDNQQGLTNRFSDYVGRFEMNPHPWLQLNYRFRLDRKTLHQRVSEVGASVGPSLARLTGEYVFISKKAGTPDKMDFNQINLNFSSLFIDQWTFKALLKKNLRSKKERGGTLEKGIGLAYRDDCFGLEFMAKRQYYSSRDVKPATIFMATLYLKNIGNFNYSFNLDNGIVGERTEKKD